MSSDQTIKPVSMDNYEEYLLLYVDGELTPGQMNEVDAFLASHPFLQPELDALMETRLDAEAIVFDKSGLFAEDMKKFSAQEDLLLYLDGELPADKADALRRSLTDDASLREHYALLRATKLDPADHVPYPNHAELMRSEKRRTLVPVWMRIAAAAAVVLVAGLMYFNQPKQQDAGDQGTVAMQGEAGKPTTPASTSHKDHAVIPAAQAPVSQDLAVAPTMAMQQPATTHSTQHQASKINPNLPSTATQGLAQQQSPEVQQDDPYTPTAPASRNIAAMGSNLSAPVIAASAVIPKNFSALPVTLDSAPRTTDVASTQKDNSHLKGSVKGFLRKATQLIEKTGIDPVNDDGELLIAAIAVKVK